MRPALVLALLAATLSPAAPVAAQTPAQKPVQKPAPSRAGFDVTESSITDLQAALAAGRTSSVALVDAYLARIAAYDHAGPELNSLIRLNPKARAEAAALDAERKAGKTRGPLHGIPVIVKDNYDTRDLPRVADHWRSPPVSRRATPL